MFEVACIQLEARDVSQYEQTEKEILEWIDSLCSEEKVDLLVFPECAWPAYFLGENEEAAELALKRTPNFMKEVAQRAAHYRVHIAMGLYVQENGLLRNAGFLWGPEGEILGRVYKSNLWHFDRKFIEAGELFSVIDTSLGKLGMMICADGRAPEIARILAEKGAEVIIDMANLVSSASSTTLLMNPQIEYMLPVRAFENGVWIILCDKVGLEAYSIMNTGRSCVINPLGHVIGSSPSDTPEALIATVDTEMASYPLPDKENRCFARLTDPTEELPVTSLMAKPMVLAETGAVCSAAHFSAETADRYVAMASRMIRVLQDQDASLISLPDCGKKADFDEVVHKLRPLLNPKVVVCVGGLAEIDGHKKRAAIAFSKDNTYGPIFLDKACRPVVFSTEAGRIGLVIEEEMFLPEVARSMMLEGVQVLFWADAKRHAMTEKIARCRAAENRVFLIRAGCGDKEDNSFIVSPTGNICAITVPGMDQSASAYCLLGEAYSKTVITGTDVVLGRLPHAYKELRNTSRKEE